MTDLASAQMDKARHAWRVSAARERTEAKLRELAEAVGAGRVEVPRLRAEAAALFELQIDLIVEASLIDAAVRAASK